MKADILLRSLEKVGHELLGQPYRLVKQANINFDLAVFGLVHQKLALTGKILAHWVTSMSMSWMLKTLQIKFASFE